MQGQVVPVLGAAAAGRRRAPRRAGGGRRRRPGRRRRTVAAAACAASSRVDGRRGRRTACPPPAPRPDRRRRASASTPASRPAAGPPPGGSSRVNVTGRDVAHRLPDDDDLRPPRPAAARAVLEQGPALVLTAALSAPPSRAPVPPASTTARRWVGMSRDPRRPYCGDRDRDAPRRAGATRVLPRPGGQPGRGRGPHPRRRRPGGVPRGVPARLRRARVRPRAARGAAGRPVRRRRRRGGRGARDHGRGGHVRDVPGPGPAVEHPRAARLGARGLPQDPPLRLLRLPRVRPGARRRAGAGGGRGRRLPGRPDDLLRPALPRAGPAARRRRRRGAGGPGRLGGRRPARSSTGARSPGPARSRTRRTSSPSASPARATAGTRSSSTRWGDVVAEAGAEAETLTADAHPGPPRRGAPHQPRRCSTAGCSLPARVHPPSPRTTSRPTAPVPAGASTRRRPEPAPGASAAC